MHKNCKTFISQFFYSFIHVFYIQIPLCGYEFSLLPCAIFFFGYMQVFASFLHIFIEGGVGKNGSTVAVRFLSFFFLPMYNKMRITHLYCSIQILRREV